MECQECHQRPATVHLTKVINGDKTEVHVCEQCAKEKGYAENTFSLNDLLSGLFNFDQPSSFGGEKAQSSATEAPKQLQCPKCGLTYQEFTRIGKFGCTQCYQTFDERLNPIFRRVHSGNTTHDGKIPKRVGGNLHLQRQISEKKQELHQLIEKEEFEKAADVRDHIRELEKQLQQEGGDD
ncbi:UvrB/UvrC motif-containing protein [Thalassobacillus pellis]|uniref:UvrB/UvrC motif-containing protein n=1 Tax=Thalassobacillus pellis TaxID=748008 RepID=UPI0019613BDA|nr:UvrB/UvrC motif-containing protein [Thalassobacillus pellis]MBM7555119.1 protein arginine kinase activator [Thalassobacillus pellis]